MDKSKIVLLFHTIRYLKPKQVYFRVYYSLRNFFFPIRVGKNLKYSSNEINLSIGLPASHSYKNKTFTFLNIKHKFDKINWNFSDYGKLWTYNLNYFDFLNQDNISKKEGLILIEDYIDQQPHLIVGLESYTISLRIVNWIKFISKYQIKNDKIDLVLFTHLTLLNRKLEYHLLGNHLLENAFALLYGAYYFRDNSIYKRAKNLLEIELNEQILSDGAHFELSPMYHKIILNRMLDCVNLVQKNNFFKDNLLNLLEVKSTFMLAWLKQVTYRNGNTPRVNDSVDGIVASSNDIFTYSNELNLKVNNSKLTDSGYRKFVNNKFELFMDVGKIGPDYIPGHSHADTFSFELHFKDKPIIVDTGISTYDEKFIRQLERSTRSHNTILIDRVDSSEMWANFRVARRANIINFLEDINKIEAKHDGYKRLGAYHSRFFNIFDDLIIIKDKIQSKTKHHIESFLHFHPNCSVSIEGTFVKVNDNLKIEIIGAKNIFLEDYDYSHGFNNKVNAKKIRALVKKKSRIEIKF